MRSPKLGAKRLTLPWNHSHPGSKIWFKEWHFSEMLWLKDQKRTGYLLSFFHRDSWPQFFKSMLVEWKYQSTPSIFNSVLDNMGKNKWLSPHLMMAVSSMDFILKLVQWTSKPLHWRKVPLELWKVKSLLFISVLCKVALTTWQMFVKSQYIKQRKGLAHFQRQGIRPTS